MLPCFPYEYHTKLPSNHCKLLPSLIREACEHCHVSCLKTPSSLIYEEEETLPVDSDLDNKHVIILEIRSRAMKAKAKPKEYLFAESFHWVNLSPTTTTTGKLLTAPKGERNGGGEDEEDNDDESEVFYSVKSGFSRCSSELGGRDEYCQDFRRRSILEEFCHCEGWPFGLRRRGLMLPPLPSSPSDSWTWHKGNLVTKV